MRENVILFHGCDTQVGTTMVALAAAEQLAEEGHSVLYISAGAIPGNPFLEADAAGAAVDLWGSSFEEVDIRQLATEHHGVDVLQGVRSWMNNGSSMMGLLQEICSKSSPLWDWVIIDGGSCGEAGMGRDALEFSSKIFLIITQQEKSLQRWRMRREWLENRMKAQPYYIVNKFIGNGTFYTEGQMQKLLQCDSRHIAAVPYMPYGWQAEKEHCTLMKYRPFRRAVKKAIRMIWEDDWKDKSEEGNHIETSEG